MSDETIESQRTHLPVLPHSGKVEQLRQEVAMSNQTPEDRVAEATQPTTEAPAPGDKSIEYKLLEGKVIAALSSVYDPEIPVNIYELGLIYNIAIDAEKNVTIRMTLTAPACPVAGTLPAEVGKKAEAIDEAKKPTAGAGGD